MTDRVSGYVIALDSHMREDDAKAVLTAIKMIRGVASVEAVSGDHQSHIEYMKASRQWRDKILALLD